MIVDGYGNDDANDCCQSKDNKYHDVPLVCTENDSVEKVEGNMLRPPSVIYFFDLLLRISSLFTTSFLKICLFFQNQGARRLK
jgi:hypothetical protein